LTGGHEPGMLDLDVVLAVLPCRIFVIVLAADEDWL
jgi:hypothetical protein